MKQML